VTASLKEAMAKTWITEHPFRKAVLMRNPIDGSWMLVQTEALVAIATGRLSPKPQNEKQLVDASE
jgi:hypothetical protein